MKGPARLRHRRGSGFSLLELVVAIAILAIGMVGALQAVTQGLNVSGEARDRTVGIELAEQKLAERLLQGDLDAGREEGDFGDDYARYRWVLDTDSTDTDGLLRLHITVSWKAGVREHAVDLETCYAPDALVSDTTPSTDMGTDQTTTGPAAGAPTPPGGLGGPGGMALPPAGP
ncbi:MAG: type II secretion system minor pseudopilin GspI [Armatimonadetes bacterium]|nr:type II secretion system minor pseudopilin GspI [Armatimonadota bacterium]